MTALLSSLKTFFLICLFLASAIVCYVLFLVYSLAAYAAVGLAFAIISAIVIAITPFLRPESGAPWDVFLVIIFAIDLLLVAGITFATLLTFVLSPLKIMRAIGSGPRETSSGLGEVAAYAASRIGVRPFSAITECLGFYLGVVKVGSRSCLCADPSFLDFISKEEMAAILAHEYGHLQPGRSICYGFLRRSMIAVSFLQVEILTDDSSVFRRTVRWATAVFPPILKEGCRSVSYHLGRIYWLFYNVWLKLLTGFLRNEFYEAEFNSDAIAKRAFGESFANGLVKAAMLQYLCRAAARSADKEAILAGWPTACTAASKSHPSLQSRLLELRADALLDSAQQGRLLKQLMETAVSPANSPQSSRGSTGNRIPLVQALCFDEYFLGDARLVASGTAR